MSHNKHNAQTARYATPQNNAGAKSTTGDTNGYSPPKVTEQYDGIENKDPNPSGWTSINKSIYQGLMEQDFYPALYYTDSDAAVGKNGEGFTESDETVQHKFYDREKRPLG